MIKKTLHILMIIAGMVVFLSPSKSDAADYGRRLSLSERNFRRNRLIFCLLRNRKALLSA